jgi:hypothetical protein
MKLRYLEGANSPTNSFIFDFFLESQSITIVPTPILFCNDKCVVLRPRNLLLGAKCQATGHAQLKKGKTDVTN